MKFISNNRSADIVNQVELLTSLQNKLYALSKKAREELSADELIATLEEMVSCTYQGMRLTQIEFSDQEVDAKFALLTSPELQHSKELENLKNFMLFSYHHQQASLTLSFTATGKGVVKYALYPKDSSLTSSNSNNTTVPSLEGNDVYEKAYLALLRLARTQQLTNLSLLREVLEHSLSNDLIARLRKNIANDNSVVADYVNFVWLSCQYQALEPRKYATPQIETLNSARRSLLNKMSNQIENISIASAAISSMNSAIQFDMSEFVFDKRPREFINEFSPEFIEKFRKYDGEGGINPVEIDDDQLSSLIELAKLKIRNLFNQLEEFSNHGCGIASYNLADFHAEGIKFEGRRIFDANPSRAIFYFKKLVLQTGPHGIQIMQQYLSEWIKELEKKNKKYTEKAAHTTGQLDNNGNMVWRTITCTEAELDELDKLDSDLSQEAIQQALETTIKETIQKTLKANHETIANIHSIIEILETVISSFKDNGLPLTFVIPQPANVAQSQHSGFNAGKPSSSFQEVIQQTFEQDLTLEEMMDQIAALSTNNNENDVQENANNNASKSYSDMLYDFRQKPGEAKFSQQLSVTVEELSSDYSEESLIMPINVNSDVEADTEQQDEDNDSDSSYEFK